MKKSIFKHLLLCLFVFASILFFPFVVAKADSTNADLSDLQIDGVTITGFAKDDFEYDLSVSKDTESITILATAEDENATIEGDGVKALDIGENEFDIVVTSQDQTVTNTYTINVTRASLSSNAYLSDLTVDGVTVDGFNKDTLVYNLSVLKAIDNVTIGTTTEDGNATVVGDGVQLLNIGANSFDIVVTSEDETTTKTYKVNIERKTARQITFEYQNLKNGSERLITGLNNYYELGDDYSITGTITVDERNGGYPTVLFVDGLMSLEIRSNQISLYNRTSVSTSLFFNEQGINIPNNEPIAVAISYVSSGHQVGTLNINMSSDSGFTYNKTTQINCSSCRMNNGDYSFKVGDYHRQGSQAGDRIVTWENLSIVHNATESDMPDGFQYGYTPRWYQDSSNNNEITSAMDLSDNQHIYGNNWIPKAPTLTQITNMSSNYTVSSKVPTITIDNAIAVPIVYSYWDPNLSFIASMRFKPKSSGNVEWSDWVDVNYDGSYITINRERDLDYSYPSIVNDDIINLRDRQYEAEIKIITTDGINQSEEVITPFELQITKPSFSFNAGDGVYFSPTQLPNNNVYAVIGQDKFYAVAGDNYDNTRPKYARFPAAQLDGYVFNGWWTEATGGDQVVTAGGSVNNNNSYIDSNGIVLGTGTLYAQYTTSSNPINVTMGDNVVSYDYGTQYLLGENIIDKQGRPTGDGLCYSFWLTLDYQYEYNYTDRGHICRAYSPDGWLINDVKYDNDEIITLTEDIDVSPNYDVRYRRDYWSIDYSLPEDLTRTGYTFDGWYDDPTGGNKISLDDLDLAWGPSKDFTLYAHWIPDPITVTLPDLTQVTMQWGDTFTLGENDIVKANDDGAAITFKYQDNVTPDSVLHVTNTYSPNGWRVTNYDNDNKYYDDNTVIVLQGDTTITANYDLTRLSPEFPVASREGYTFIAWSSSQSGGAGTSTYYTSYNGVNDLTLYAKWSRIELHVYRDWQQGFSYVDYGNSLNLGKNDVNKSDDILSQVTFRDRFYSEVDDYAVLNVKRKYTPNGWIVNGVEYADNAVITVTEDLYISRNYIEEIVSPVFPTLTRGHYIFDGWYDAENDGTLYTSYTDPENDIILYSHWTGEDITVFLPDLTEVTMHYGDVYNLGENTTPKATITPRVTFKYQDNETVDTTMDITKSYTINGWLVNGVEYNDNELLTLTEYTEIRYNYDETIVKDSFPTPTRDNYTFLGWFDDPTAGNEYTDYTGDDDITLYAHWLGDDIIVTLPDNTTITKHYGDTYDLGVNDGHKNNQTVLTVYYRNLGKNYSYGHIYKVFTPSGWLVNDTQYSDNEIITIVEPITITPYFAESYTELDLPTTSPTRSHYIFQGWFDQETGGNEITSSYFGTGVKYFYSQWLGEEHTLTLADGTVIPVRYDDTYTLGTNTEPKASEEVSTVTFKYQDGDTIDSTGHVMKVYTPNGWNITYTNSVTGTTSSYTRSDGVYISIAGDTVVDYNYSESYASPEFPTPTRDHYIFNGWYDDPTGGSKVTSYNGTTDKTLYAHWTGEDITITLPNNTLTRHYGDTYTLGTNNSYPGNTNGAKVYFDDYSIGYYERNQYVTISKSPNGWLVDGVHYENGASIVLTGNITVEYNYIVTYTSPTFPTPSRSYFNFDGWYDDTVGGNLYTSYNGTENITLYPHWAPGEVKVYLPDGEEESYTYGDTYTLGVNNVPKPDEDGARITFVYNDDETPDSEEYVIKRFTPNGWYVNYSEYDDNEVFTLTQNTSLEYRYSYELISPEFPTPTREGYEFLGWYYEGGNAPCYGKECGGEIDPGYHSTRNNPRPGSGESDTSNDVWGDPVTSYNGENDITLYARWIQVDEDQVLVNWDGEFFVYNKKSKINLDREENKEYDGLAVVVGLMFEGTSYDDDIVYINKHVERTSYLINGEPHIATGVYILLENTTIESQYTETYDYPDMPTYDYEGFVGFTDEEWNPVTTFEGIEVLCAEIGQTGVNPGEDPGYHSGMDYGNGKDDGIGDSDVCYLPLYADFEKYHDLVNVYVNGEFFSEYERGVWSIPRVYPDNNNYYLIFDYDVDDDDNWTDKGIEEMYNDYWLDYNMIDGVRYTGSEEYNYQNDTYITNYFTSRASGYPDYNFIVDKRMDIGKQREASEDHYYYLEGWYTEPNGQGTKVFINGKYGNVLVPEALTGDARNSEVGQRIYAHWILDPEVNVTIDDNEPYEYMAGPNTLIPVDKEVSTTKEDDTFNVTFDYQDGNNTIEVEQATKSYNFNYYIVDGNENNSYSRNDIYNFYHDTTIESVYNINVTYPELPEVDNDLFKGWYTKPVGGQQITGSGSSWYYSYSNSEDEITDDITLYAQYYSGYAHINYDGNEYDAEIGTPITLDFEEYTDDITLNFVYGPSELTKPVHYTSTYTPTEVYVNVWTDNSNYSNSYQVGDVIIATGNIKITPYYDTEITNDFVGYSENEWDYGYTFSDSEYTYEISDWYLKYYPYDNTCEGRGCLVDYENEDITNWFNPSYPDLHPEMDNTNVYAYYSYKEPINGNPTSVHVEFYDTIENEVMYETYVDYGELLNDYPDNMNKDGYIIDDLYIDAELTKPIYFDENYSFDEGLLRVYDDTIIYIKWIEDVRTDENQCIITLPDDTNLILDVDETFDIGVNNIVKAPDNQVMITFNYEDGVTPATVEYVQKVYTPNGWFVYEYPVEDNETYTCQAGDWFHIRPRYEETIETPTFPEPTRSGYTFYGWLDGEVYGNYYYKYTGDEDIMLYAHWDLSASSDFTLDSYELNMIVGDTHQVEATFTPEGTEDTLVYSGYDDEIVSVTEEGLITALSSGETTITVVLSSDNTITKEISVSVMGDKITSSLLDIVDKTTYKIIIGEEPNTKIATILEKIDNNEYIKVYTKNDELVDPDNYSTELIKTGMKLKLVINEVEKDEVIVVIRGDVDGDGLVNVTDLAPVEWHILEDERDYLEGYYKDAVDLDGDGIVDVRDEGKLMKYILEDESVPTLND